MIAKARILQLSIAACAAYLIFAMLVKALGDKTWLKSPASLSYSSTGDSVFEHIQNRTLGVSPYHVDHYLICRFEY